MRKPKNKAILILTSPLLWIIGICSGMIYQEFFSSSISVFLAANCGNSPTEVLSGQYYRLFTALFLHQDIFHFAGNMIPLALLTWIISASITRLQYLMVLFFSGVIGNLLADIFITRLYKLNGHIWSFLTTFGYTDGSIGMSTAIEGLLFFATIVFLLTNLERFNKVKFKLGLLVLVILSQILGAYQNLSTNPWLDLASYTHFGGGLTGTLLAIIFLYRHHLKAKPTIDD